MKKISQLLIPITILLSSRSVFAGEFYNLFPRWLELGYNGLLAIFMIVGFFICLSIYNNFKGGKLSMPWIIIMIAFLAALVRLIMSVLTIMDIQYFVAIAFAGMDILFFILLLIGLILYKVGLE